ncbi:MAG TPA: class I SAM-dependent methyltransferase [Thermoleophilaceae bacterium]
MGRVRNRHQASARGAGPLTGAGDLPCGHRAVTRLLYTGEDRLCGVSGRFEVSACAACGLGATVPRLSSAELGPYYPDSYPAFRPPPPRTSLRDRVGGRLDDVRFSAAMRFGAFRPLVRAGSGRLLDVGCGRGDLAHWFAARGWRVAGVEPGAEAAAQAAARGIEMHHGTLDDVPWPPSSFDAISFNHSLEHVHDPLRALVQARTLLRPGGLLIVSVPNFDSWQRRLFGSRWFHLDLPRHLQHFGRVSLTAIARSAGLEPIQVRATSSLAGLPGSIQYAVAGKLTLSDTAMHRTMHLAYPLSLIGDLFGEADCLHLVCRA